MAATTGPPDPGATRCGASDVAAQLDIDARGVDTLRASLSAAADYLREGMPRAEADAAQLIAERARSTTAPVHTGHLASTISASAGTVAAAADYARPVHARDPFVTEAKAQLETEIVAVFTTDAQRLLDDVKGT